MAENESPSHPPRRPDSGEARLAAPEAAAWWDGEDVLTRLPAASRSLAERLQAQMFQPDGRFVDTLAEHHPDLGVDQLAEIVHALRTGIGEAAARGAPASAVRRLHESLDGEALRMARLLIRQTRAEHRRILQDVSHDIRSPLNSILFLADTLLGGRSGELSEIQRRQLGVLYTAAVTLVSLVNDVIDAARLQEGTEIPVSHVSFSVESVLNDVESLVAPLAAHRGVKLRFHLETLGPRSGDRQLLARVLINLVTNAIKAAEEEGSVEIHASEAADARLRVRVSDDGPTGDLEDLRAFLEEDEGEAYPVSGSAGWTHGLGLTICSRLARAAGGSIEVDKAGDRGTRFTVSLPFARV